MENVGSRRVVACSCQSIEPVILIWESWWRQANRRGPKPWYLYSSSSILEPTRMYIWIGLNCQEPYAGCPLKPQDASRSRADKIRSAQVLREPCGTFCDIPESKVTWPPSQCLVDAISRDHPWLFLDYSGRYSFFCCIYRWLWPLFKCTAPSRGGRQLSVVDSVPSIIGYCEFLETNTSRAAFGLCAKSTRSRWSLFCRQRYSSGIPPYSHC